MPPSPALPARLFARIDWLAGQPFLLLCLLLAANGLVRPYAGLIHDSRLYAAQVTEHVAPGTLAQDLYLRYGSQDGYTIFSLLLAPLVRLVGLDAAFLVAYLLCKALLFWALIRLVLALVEDRPAALAALFYLAVAVLPFGGNGIFHLNETFLTPRIPASALVLLALRQMLLGRRWPVLPLLAGSLLLHPLMAFAGVLVVLPWWLVERLTRRQLVALGAVVALAAAVVAGFEPAGRYLFGHMDAEWRGITLDVCFYIRPACWTAGDWLRTALAGLVVAGAAWTFARHRAIFLVAVLVAGGLGLLGSLLAVRSGHRLLIQSAPYRALWLLELLAVPLGFAAVARLWRTGRPLACCAAPALLLLLTADWQGDPFPPLLLFLALLPGCALFCRGVAARPNRPDWLAASAARAGLATVGLLCLYDLAELVLRLGSQPTFYRDSHPVETLITGAWALFKLPLLLVVLGIAAGLRRAGSLRWQAAGLLGFCLAYQGLLTGLNAWPGYTDRFSAWKPHGRFVAEYLRARQRGRPAPLTVYWTADLRDVWFGAGVNSYYNRRQLAGCGFARGTAVEGKRRARLVAAFEMGYLGRMSDSCVWMKAHRRFYEQPPEARPTEQDLFRLCAEEGLDFVVLEDRFVGLSCAGDGCYHIYDCRQVRALAAQRRRAAPGSPSCPSR